MDDDFEHSPDCPSRDPVLALCGGARLAAKLQCCEAAMRLLQEYEGAAGIAPHHPSGG